MPGPAPLIIELVGDHHTHEPEGRSVYCKGNVSAMNTNCLATHGHKVGTNMLTTTNHEQIGNQSPQVNLLTGIQSLQFHMQNTKLLFTSIYMYL